MSAVLARLRNAVEVSSFCKLDQRLAANGPTGRQVAQAALALPPAEGDEALRQALQEYLKGPGA